MSVTKFVSTKFNRRSFVKSLAAGSLLSTSYPVFSQDRKLGVALVGLGYYSRDLLAPALQLTQYCELRGIVTGSPEKIPVWQKQYAIKDKNVYNYENMHTLANNDDIDVVYIVVPTGLHHKYALIAANAGKHVWCEKPMAMTVAECQEIIDTCKKNNVRLSIGYRMQHEPNTQTVMQYARQKPYGDITRLRVEAGYGGTGGSPDYWRMQKHMGGGAMYDMGVYAVNAARYATAMEPLSISASHDDSLKDVFTEVDHTTYFTLNFSNDVKAECMTSVVINKNSLYVECSSGWYGLKPMQSYSGIVGFSSDDKFPNRDIPNQQAKQMDNDALAIMRNSTLLVPGEEGLTDIRIVEAAFKSAATGKTVKI